MTAVTSYWISTVSQAHAAAPSPHESVANLAPDSCGDLLVFSAFLDTLLMSVSLKGGARQRLRSRLEEERRHRDDTTSASSSALPPKGGIRQRVGVKRKRGTDGDGDIVDGSDPDELARQIYRKSVVQKYLLNRIAACELKDDIRKSFGAGAGGVADLAAPSTRDHAARSLHRAISKGCDAPPLYEVHDVPIHNPTTGKDGDTATIPVLLPHEVLWYKLKDNPEMLAHIKNADLPTGVGKLKQDWCKKFDVPSDECFGLGVFGDGVQHQKRKTVDTITWNVLESGVFATRILYAIVAKDFLCKCGCAGRCTLDPLLTVFVWSLLCLLHNLLPKKRHDLSPWEKSDQERATWKGPLGFYGAMLQIRGDWAWYKQLFSFPSWAAHSICWKCGANCSDMPWDDFSARAKFRNARMNAATFFRRQRKAGITPSPLFSAPGFVLAMVCIGVLHCCDLGVTQEIIGNVMWEALEALFVASNREKRKVLLWADLKRYYKLTKPPSQIQGLTVEMIKKDKKAPKLRAKGGETRHVLPYAVELARRLHDKYETQHSFTVMKCVGHLFDWYMNVSMGTDFEFEWGQESSAKFLQLYKPID